MDQKLATSFSTAKLSPSGTKVSEATLLTTFWSFGGLFSDEQ